MTLERFKNGMGELYEPVPFSGCIVWIRGCSSWGYGDVNVGARRISAHRLSFEIANGPIPDGMCVLHRCDVPACINPRHLFLGTKGDNNRDATEKGRNKPPRGEICGAAKITRVEVLEIRRRYFSGDVLQRQLAAEYGICQQTVSDIVNHKKWAWLYGELKEARDHDGDESVSKGRYYE